MAVPERAAQRKPRQLSEAKRRRFERRLEAAKPGAARPLTIPKRSDREPAPLSYPQLSFWLLDQIDPGSPAYNLPHGVVFSGPLDITALERSLQQILNRHDVLRTRFDVIDGGPRQIVLPMSDFSLALIDFSDLGTRERDTAVAALLAEEALAPFDLAGGPPIRLKLLKRAEDDHVLVSVCHHVAFDGWSYGVFFRELGHFYEAFSSGKKPALAEPGIQYADFAAWQRQQLDDVDQGGHLSYWQERLAGPLGVLELPADRPRPAAPTFKGRRYTHFFEPGLSQSLEELASLRHATLFMVLLAAFDVVLMRHTGETDVIVGTPFANRSIKETEGVIGCFVNTLVLRSDLAGDPTFDALLDHVRQSAFSAYEHAACPFQKIVETLKPERDPARMPFFQVMFQLNNTPDGDMHMDSGSSALLAVSELTLSTIATNIDISVDMYETDDGLHGRVEYNSALYDEATIARLMASYEMVLADIAADQSKPLSAYSVMDGQIEQTILQRWNATDHAVPQGIGLHDVISGQALRSANSTALLFEGSSMSYRALECWSNRVAHGLMGAGLAKGAMIGLCLDNGFALIAGLLGIMKAGGVFVALDPAYPTARLAFMIEDSAVAAILTEPALVAAVAAASPKSEVTLIALDGADDPFAGLPETAPETGAAGEDPAYVIYTSGSTGRPKGVLVPHRALLNHMAWSVDDYAITAGDPHLLIANYSFDTALWEIFAPLMRGAPLVIPRREEAQDPGRLIALIRDHEVSHIQTVPTLLRLLAEHPSFNLCRSLKHIFCGGEELPVALMEAVLQQLDIALHNAYGPTETTIDATVWRCDPKEIGASVPIGRPIRNTRCYVLDDAMAPVPLGVAGEIYIGGAGVALGYLNRPELNAAAFVADPFSASANARLYRSGDLARWRADGLLEYLGRRDGQIKLRGLRIELGEIEHAMQAHPAVSQAIVAVRDDAPDGGRLVGFYLPTGAERPGRADFRGAMNTMLPDYMIPQVFVAIDAIPVTKNGKTDRRALPAPTGAEPRSNDHREPLTSTEAALAEIWCSLLKLETIGTDDDFFEIGGHSLLAVRMIAAVETATGVRLPLQALFKGATIRHMADALSVAGREQAARPFVSFNEAGERTPFWFEHGDYVGGGFYCRKLAEALGTRQPFHALTPHGADGKRFPERIEAMAANHVRLIREHQPTGPYRLGGHCNGGLLAFDMARQLKAMGEQVDIVVLIATPSYNLRPWILKAYAVLQKLNGPQGRATVDYWLRRLNWLRGLVVPLGFYKHHLRQLESRSIANEIATLGKILVDYYRHKTARDTFDRLYRDIIDRYVPGSYAGRVALLAPVEEAGRRSNLEPEVWRMVAPNLEIQAVPGQHLTCITDHLEDLAAALNRLLD